MVNTNGNIIDHILRRYYRLWLLDELDKELERRWHKFHCYMDDCNVYVRGQRAGERVVASVKQFLEKRLQLQLNEKKSKVAKAEECNSSNIKY